MSDEIKEKAEEIAEEIEEVIEQAIETPTEVEAQIAVAKAEAAVDRVVEAANILEIAAQIEVANITQQAEQQIAEHIETVEILEGSLEWAHERIKYLQDSMDKLWMKVEQLESNQSTQVLSTQMDPGMPETVAIQESAVEVDPQDPPENLVAEALEAVAEVPQKVVRKIRAL